MTERRVSSLFDFDPFIFFFCRFVSVLPAGTSADDISLSILSPRPSAFNYLPSVRPHSSIIHPSN